MKDIDLEAYVEAIESHFRARRGADHVLTPRDFALARAWQQAGVPLVSVLVGIDRAFESGANVSSLGFCRRHVEGLAAAGPRPGIRPALPAEGVPLKELEGLLAALLGRLLRLRPGPQACFEPPLRKLEELQQLLDAASRPNWDRVRGKLREIDLDVSAAVLQALPSAEAAAYRAEATRAVERHRGRVDSEALAEAVERFVLQRARERLELPHVSLG